MNVRRIPALFAMVFAASACTPTLVMLENAPQAPAPAYGVELNGSTAAEPASAPQADGLSYDVSTGVSEQPSTPPAEGPVYDVSTGVSDQSSAPPVYGPTYDASTGPERSSAPQTPYPGEQVSTLALTP
jgi:hypothetical protein